MPESWLNDRHHHGEQDRLAVLALEERLRRPTPSPRAATRAISAHQRRPGRRCPSRRARLRPLDVPVLLDQPARALRDAQDEQEEQRRRQRPRCRASSARRRLGAADEPRRSRSSRSTRPGCPTTTLNWLTATSRPRRLAGAISAMYMGATTEAPPIAEPAEEAEAHERQPVPGEAAAQRRDEVEHGQTTEAPGGARGARPACPRQSIRRWCRRARWRR